MRYSGNQPRTATVGRAPRITLDEQQLEKEYRKYRRMGFDAREARFKARLHHTMKL